MAGGCHHGRDQVGLRPRHAERDAPAQRRADLKQDRGQCGWSRRRARRSCRCPCPEGCLGSSDRRGGCQSRACLKASRFHRARSGCLFRSSRKHDRHDLCRSSSSPPLDETKVEAAAEHGYVSHVALAIAEGSPRCRSPPGRGDLVRLRPLCAIQFSLAGRIRNVDLVVAVAHARERDLLASSRPRYLGVFGQALGEPEMAPLSNVST